MVIISEEMIYIKFAIKYNLVLIFGRLFDHNPILWIEIQSKKEGREGRRYLFYAFTEQEISMVSSIFKYQNNTKK